ncbi:MAG TPA: class I SAM-dependent methyltransferase [Gaiellaceae bacterium]|nr:class I SAM-dependent methyltransferase [Gaiellaceae bacterium]
MNEMRERWDLRARSDAFAYIETVREVPSVDSFFALGEHFAQVLADPVLGNVERSRALDLGCGVGRVTRALAQRFDDVVGVDVSAEMVRRAKELHPAAEFPNVTFEATDGVHVPLEAESVDFVFSYEVFQHLPSREVIRGNLVEVARVLRPDGLALIHVHRPPGPGAYWLERAKRAVPDSLWMQLKRAVGRGDPLTSDATFRGTAPLRRKDIAELWHAVGLAIVELRNDPTHEPARRVLVSARRKR